MHQYPFGKLRFILIETVYHGDRTESRIGPEVHPALAFPQSGTENVQKRRASLSGSSLKETNRFSDTAIN